MEDRRDRQVSPGTDGVVRVVTIQDKGGTRKMSTHSMVSLSHLTEPEVARQ